MRRILARTSKQRGALLVGALALVVPLSLWRMDVSATGHGAGAATWATQLPGPESPDGASPTAARLADGERELFPLPESLRPAVEFWIKIYAFYTTDQALVHDSRYMDIVYEVVDLGPMKEKSRRSARARWRKVENIKRRYQRILRRLDKKRPKTEEGLSDEERKVFRMWVREDDPYKFRKAASRCRGQLGQRDRFEMGVIRSGLYINEIQRVFREHGLPNALTVMPHVESSFNYKAYSKVGAAGIWQFTRSTGRRYMRINYQIDERLDPVAATHAAARLLKQNYDELGAWPLAITAYNHGLGGMKRAQRLLKTSDIGLIVQKYRSRSFGFASRNFYAEFLAAKYVIQNKGRFFGNVKPLAPLRSRLFVLPDYVKFSTLARTFDISQEELADLNPALRPPVTSSRRYIPKGHALRLPDRPEFDADRLYARLGIEERHAEQVRAKWYRVRRGDNLSTIARRFGVPVYSLMARNNIDNAHRIYVGQTLEVPARSDVFASVVKPTTPRVTVTKPKPRPEASGSRETRTSTSTAPATTPPASSRPPVVSAKEPAIAEAAPAETGLSSEQPSATKFHFSPTPEALEALAEMDAIFPSDNLAVEFAVDVPEPEGDYTRVLPDETLGHLADWLEIPTQTLRNLNGIRWGASIRADQRIRLSFRKVTRDVFQQRRVEYHKSIREDFFTSFTIDGVTNYTVSPGESIWYITHRRYEVPSWLLMYYNQDQDLAHLHPGDQLVIPTIVDRSYAPATDGTD